ncbi:MAG: glycosyltransferase family 9 protein [Candidatus Eisenbacteria bacterium]
MSGAVLAIRPRAMGDVVLTTPALASLAAGHPDRALVVVTDARYAELLEPLPFVARVIRLGREWHATVRAAHEAREHGPAIAVDFFGNSRTALVAKLSGANRCFGYDLRGRRAFYDVTVPRETRFDGDRREHASAVHLRLARAAGGAEVPLAPRLATTAAAREDAAALFARSGVHDPANTVGLVAAGTWPTKTWPVSHAAVLAKRLMAAGRDVLVLDGPGEGAVTRRVAALAPGVRVLPPCGLSALVAVIERLGAVVGTDSGPRHLAAALGVPSFAWFGPTHPDTWNPPGELHGYWRTSLPCRGCDRTHCAHWNCLPGLDGDTAAALVLAHLERVKPPARRAS